MLVFSTSRWKISVKNINTDSGKLSLMMCAASFFHTFCWTDKRTNICVPSWDSPQVGNPPLVAACGLTSAERHHRRRSSKQSSTSLASAPDSESVSATIISLMAFSSSLIFFPANAYNYNGLPYLVSSVWLAQFQKSDASEIWMSSAVTVKQI